MRHIIDPSVRVGYKIAIYSGISVTVERKESKSLLHSLFEYTKNEWRRCLYYFVSVRMVNVLAILSKPGPEIIPTA